MAFIPHNEKLMSLDIIRGTEKFVTLGDYYPLPYTDSACVRIKKYLENNEFAVLSPNQAKDLSPEELNQLNYLMLSLDAFYKQDNKYHSKKEWLIPLTMNHDGPKYLKRLRLKSFLTSNRSTLLEKPEWWDNIKEISITDIGEIFNYNYAFNWEAPDENDYLYSREPLDPDPVFVEEFRSTAERLIDAALDFEYVSLNDILFKVTSSKTMQDGKTFPNYRIKSNHLHVSSRRSEGKRVFITTSPGTGRDAIINTVEDLNTIQYINENVKRFLEKNFSEHLLLRSYDQNYKKYRRMCKKSSFFYCRDIKKEGITKPKYLTKIMLECLKKRYPDCTAFTSTDFYLGPWYEGDTTGRGHGLGMANELTTLMQIIIFYVTNKMLGDEGNYIASTKSLFLNDDAVIFFKETDYQQVEDFADMDFEVCSKLGVLAQKDKSFISEYCCVFCEMYYSHLFPDQNDKQSYALRETSIILRAGSLLEAKFLLGNMKGSLEQVENTLKLVYSKFRHEFNKNELDWPITVGGMRPFKLRGSDLSLEYIKNLPDKESIFKAYLANKNKRLWGFNKFLKEFEPPLFKVYPSLIREEDTSILSKLGLSSIFDLACRFFRPTKEHKFHSSVKKLAIKREKAYLSAPIMTYEIFCSEYTQNSLSNVKLDEIFVDRFIPVKLFIMKDFKDPYKVTNPITAYLNKKGLTADFSCPSTIWGLFQADSDLGFEKSVFARNRTMNTLSLIDRFEEDFESEILVFPENEEDIPDFMESYPKPFLTSEFVVQGNKLPIPKLKFRNPVLKYRKEVYGKYLSFYHIKLAQELTYQELSWVIGSEILTKSDYDIIFWRNVFKKYRDKIKSEGDPFPREESSSSDDDDKPWKEPLGLIDISRVDIKYADMQISIPESENIDEEDEPLFEVFSPDNSETILKNISIEVENEKNEKLKENMFYIPNGALEDSDETVYGSIGWCRWFVQQETITLQEYTENDPYLDVASEAMMSHKLGLFRGSNLFDDKNQLIKDQLDYAAKLFWIPFYYKEWIETPEPEDEPVEFDVFE